MSGPAELVNDASRGRAAPLRVLVCGGRNYQNRDYLFATLDRFHRGAGVAVVIHGAASGADRLAGVWARANRVEEVAVPADWSTHGRAAGPIRNRAMLAYKPDIVIAFRGGHGTADMCEAARQARVAVYRAMNPDALPTEKGTAEGGPE